MDSNLYFNSHFQNITESAFYHLKNIARVRPLLHQANTEKLVYAFITSKLDYCNALLPGLPKKATDKLQLIQKCRRC